MSETEKTSFSLPFQAQWSDMDQNGHMRTTAYLTAAENSRTQYFAAHGFSMQEFTRLAVGPVIQTDEIRYRSELLLHDSAILEVRLAGISPDGARFSLSNNFVRDDGRVVCKVTTVGGWLDLRRRRLTCPPRPLVDILQALERTEDFVELTSPISLRSEEKAALAYEGPRGKMAVSSNPQEGVLS
jgi:acyl-CoA thioester hydrolase